MAMVRCPKHKIPYNDDNPRGCPACAREREGGRTSDTQVMQELARASQMIRRPSSVSGSAPEADLPVTPQPRIPTLRWTWAMRALRVFRQKRFLAISGAVIAVLAILLLATSGPKFTIAFSPAQFPGVVRPLPISPNDPVPVLFSAIGPQTPQPNEAARALERYSYGTDFTVDAQNGLIYAITLAIPNRSWRGIRVGMDETNATGAVALLASPEVVDGPAARADTIAGFITYPSLDLRPLRTIRGAVRPPNNCYDVEVDLRPRQTGTLRVGKRSLSVIGRLGGPPADWVVTRIRVVSRAMTGPYAGEPVCRVGEPQGAGPAGLPKTPGP